MQLLDLESHAHVSLESHVFIVAYGQSEPAREAYGRGAEFLKLLRGFPIDALTYRDISTYIKVSK